MNQAHRVRVASIAMLVGYLAACGGGDGPVQPPAPSPDHLVFTPASVDLSQGEVFQLGVKVIDSAGHELTGQPLSYVSTRPDLVTVSTTGSLHSVGPAGSGRIRVTSGTIADSVPVAVHQVATSIVTGPPVLVRQGTSHQLAATVLDLVNRPIPGAVVTYSTTSSAIAVTAQGLVTVSSQSGKFPVTASSGAAHGTMSIAVPTHPAGTIASVGPGDHTSWGVAVNANGFVYLTSGVNQLYRVQLPDYTLLPGPVGGAGGMAVDIALSPDGQMAYVPNLWPGVLAFVRPGLNAVVDTISRGPTVQRFIDVAAAPDGGTVYVTGDNDTLYLVDVPLRYVIATVDLHYASTRLAIDPANGHVYTSSSAAGRVIEVDPVTRTVLRTLVVGGTPQGLAFSPDGSELYIADEAGRLLTWDVAAGSQVQEIVVPAGAFGLAVTPDGAQLYLGVGAIPHGAVEIRDRATRALITTLTGLGTPRHIAFDLLGETGIVADDGGGVVFVR